MEIKKLIKDAHKNAISHGFWDSYNTTIEYKENIDLRMAFISQFLMLIVGEVAEAQEGLRHNDIDNFKEELADVAIRLADLAGGLNIDLEAEIIKKMEKNKNRPYKHNKNF